MLPFIWHPKISPPHKCLPVPAVFVFPMHCVHLFGNNLMFIGMLPFCRDCLRAITIKIFATLHSQLGPNEMAHEVNVFLVANGKNEWTVGLEDLAIGILLYYYRLVV